MYSPHCRGWNFYRILPLALIKSFAKIYKPLYKDLLNYIPFDKGFFQKRLSFEPQSKAFYGENWNVMPVSTSVMID